MHGANMKIIVLYVASRSTSVCGSQTHAKSLYSYQVFVRIGDVDVSWDNFLRPLSTRLWVVMAVCTVTMTLALRICFQVDSVQREELRTDTRLQDLVFATFGAVFCVQGKPHVGFTYFKNSLWIKMRLCLNHNLGTDHENPIWEVRWQFSWLCKPELFKFLYLWFRTSLIYINNCPTRCNTKQSIYYSGSSLYMFRVSTTPVIRSTQN